MRAGRLMISAAGSGCGKSVVTMGLLQAMKDRGIRLQSFKCGPDYIDPGFHTRVLGIGCRNLDTYLMGEDETAREMVRAEQAGLLAVAEGAMGLFDGLGGDVRHSAYYIASVCRMPVLAVLDAGGEESCAKQLAGLLEKDTQRRICAVLVNRCSRRDGPAIRRTLQEVISSAGIVCVDAGKAPERIEACSGDGTGNRIFLVGTLPALPEAVFASRHLGLKRAEEVEDFTGRIHRIAQALEESGCVGAALSLACSRGSDSSYREETDRIQSAGFGQILPPVGDTATDHRCKIAVARDEAFSFLYQGSLENLEMEGARLCDFSPLHDSSLPDSVDGLYLPGGYPELYAPMLAQNRSMRDAVREAVLSGMPTVAECGGFLYLGERLKGEDGHAYEMVRALPGNGIRTEKLVRFGYLELVQEKGDSLLFREGEIVHAHEFHYWDSDCCGSDLTARKRSKGRVWKCGYAGPNLYAAFPHLYLNRIMARRFVEAAGSWRGK